MANPDINDWEGKPLPESEPDDAIIRVWCVSRMRGEEADEIVIRDYIRFQEYITENLGVWLENYTEDDLMGSGAKLDVRLLEYKKCDYDALYVDC